MTHRAGREFQCLLAPCIIMSSAAVGRVCRGGREATLLGRRQTNASTNIISATSSKPLPIVPSAAKGLACIASHK
jgi:hypothetical protein